MRLDGAQPGQHSVCTPGSCLSPRFRSAASGPQNLETPFPVGKTKEMLRNVRKQVPELLFWVLRYRPTSPPRPLRETPWAPPSVSQHCIHSVNRLGTDHARCAAVLFNPITSCLRYC